MDRILLAVIALFGWFWLTVIKGLAPVLAQRAADGLVTTKNSH